MFTKTSLAWNLNLLHKRSKAEILKFDLEVQRRSVWNKKQKQKLMDSLIFNYPVPPLYFIDKKETDEKAFYLLDGQQRVRTVHEFYSDEFPLAKDMDTFIDSDDDKEYELKGMFYSELPEEIKKALNATNLTTYTFSNISENEIAEMFKRLNAGTPMRKMELTRVDMPNQINTLLNELSKHEFFEKINISASAKNHFTDQEVIIQSMMLLSGTYTGFSGKDINNFVMGFINKDDSTKWHSESFMEVFDRITKIVDFLNEVFDEKYKYLKKVNIPVILKVAETALQDNVTEKNFWLWIDRFYELLQPESEYTLTCTSNSAKKGNVQKRYSILATHYEKNIKKPDKEDIKEDIVEVIPEVIPEYVPEINTEDIIDTEDISAVDTVDTENGTEIEIEIDTENTEINTDNSIENVPVIDTDDTEIDTENVPESTTESITENVKNNVPKNGKKNVKKNIAKKNATKKPTRKSKAISKA